MSCPRSRQVLSSFAKWHALARGIDEVPDLIAEAFRQATSAPPGPVVLEVPVDVLEGETDLTAPSTLDVAPVRPARSGSRAARRGRGAARLGRATRALGRRRRAAAGGAAAFVALAERLGAPAATTYMGKGAIPADHPLAVGSACDEGAFQELLRTADVVLAVGTELGRRDDGPVVADVRGPPDPGRRAPRAARARRTRDSASHGDARAVLEALAPLVSQHESDGAARVRAVHERIRRASRRRAETPSCTCSPISRDALGRDDILVCDMTLTGYLAAPFLDVYAPGTFLYPLGSGTLGYAWPAAIGAKVARPDAQVLAVHGDGGVLYNVLELLSARQHRIGAKLLVVDDGGYGILRVYQEGAYGRTSKVDLAQPDFPALARSLGVPVVRSAARRRSRGRARRGARHRRPAFIHLPQTVRLSRERPSDGSRPDPRAGRDPAAQPPLPATSTCCPSSCSANSREAFRPRRSPACGRGVIDARLHAVNMPARVGRPGLHAGSSRSSARSSSDARRTRSGTSSGGRPTCCATAATSSASATCCPRSRGERRYAYAVTEPGAGSDASRLQTRAPRTTGGWRIDGEKWFVTAADVADYLIVVADAEGHGPTAFLSTRAPRACARRGVRATCTRSCTSIPSTCSRACEVPDAQVLGGLGKGHELSREWFIEERLMIAARCLGGAQRALEVALEYACEREQFGQRHRRLPGGLVPARLSAVELAAARAFVYQVAWEASRGLDPKSLHAKASAIKLHASETAGRVADRALQVLGGRGYMRENPVERLYRDLRVDRIWEGTSEIQRVVVANELVKRGAATITGWPVP